MEQYAIKGGSPLVGEVEIGGAKNAALPILAASIMTDETVLIENVPDVRDVNALLQAMESIGVVVERPDRHTVRVNGSGIHAHIIENDLIKKIRASYYLIGALLGKYREAKVVLPGGCNIGSRPIDQHIKGWKALGTKVDIAHGLISAKAETLKAGHIYMEDKLNIDRFTLFSIGNDEKLGREILNAQIRKGIKVNDGVYLRRFPIAIQRRGFHATLLSKTKGISRIANVLNDKNLKQICIDQFEWILGKNPFASSTMFGEGYNYHPLYVAFSKQMVGALPVGIMTYENNDAPYWPVKNNAVFKEIWGHTSGKFLWVISDILEMEKENE